MDKYELNIKIEQIKKLVQKKDYKTASKVGKALDLRRIKDWATLSLLINVHENVGDLEEAREAAITAYNKNLGGRRLVYQLAEISIRLKDYNEAYELYKDYVKMAPRDLSRYTLLYKIKKAQGVGDEELIDILEAYREHEVDEKYLYDLAMLYSKTEQGKACVEVCDEIITLFRDGTYVERAVRLKKQYSGLSAAQQRLYDEAAQSGKYLTEDEREESLAEVAQGGQGHDDEAKALLKGNRFKAFLSKALATPQEEEEEIGAEVEAEEEEEEEIPIFHTFREEKAKAPETAATVEMPGKAGDVSLEGNTRIFEPVARMAQKEEEEEGSEPEEVLVLEESAVQEKWQEENARYAESNAAIAAAGDTMQQLIENAKRRIDESFEQVKKEHEEERLKETAQSIEVPVREYGIYDTQNLQLELAKSLSEIFDKEEEPIIKPNPIMPEPEAEPEKEEAGQPEADEQIDGQMSISDWMEAVREEKYSRQNTKEFSKEELERLLERREAEQQEYEKMKAEMVAKTMSPKEKEREALEKMLRNAVKTDLAIRTGKATAKLEEEVRQYKLAIELELKKVQLEKEQAEGDERSAEEAAIAAVEAALAEEVLLEELAAAREDGGEAKEDGKPEAFKNPVALPEETEKVYTEPKISAIQELPEGVKKYFKKYEGVEGLEIDLVNFYAERVLRSHDMTSSCGNVMISGNRSSDKTSLAVSIVKGMNALFPENPRKIAKTTGESINSKGIAKAMNKLKGTVLIIEDAGVIESRRLEEMLEVMDTDTQAMVVVLEGSDAELNGLLKRSPHLEEKFNHRIVLKHYTVNEMVEMAKKYAQKKEYAIDDNALLQLYLSIDRMHNKSDRFKTEQIFELIDEAIARADERAGTRKLFGGFMKKHNDTGNIIIESDFQQAVKK